MSTWSQGVYNRKGQGKEPPVWRLLFRGKPIAVSLAEMVRHIPSTITCYQNDNKGYFLLLRHEEPGGPFHGSLRHVRLVPHGHVSALPEDCGLGGGLGPHDAWTERARRVFHFF